MSPNQVDFRDLYEKIVRWDGVNPRGPHTLYHAVLNPWLSSNPEHGEWLHAFAARVGDPIPAASDDDLFVLYSISRVNDVLLESFQGAPQNKRDVRTSVSLNDYLSFMTALGFRVVADKAFTPFLHEIVQVETSEDPDRHIEVVGEFWPALMLGPMLFSRAGVMVEGGSRHVVKTIAESSTLYWSFRRRNRRAADLSHGWGSNSQWRTRFRRDYAVGDQAFLNVDARRLPYLDNVSGLTEMEEMEILTHRCFVRTDASERDVWPYDLTATIPTELSFN